MDFCTPFLQTKLLTQYILNLGKYDQNYDIRDRTRFIRQLIVPSERSGALNKYARRILLAPKPAPVLESTFKGISYIRSIGSIILVLKHIKPSKLVERLLLEKYAKLMQAVVFTILVCESL